MAWCLPKHLSGIFLNRLRSGEITPDNLREMTSAERHKYFSGIFGEEHAGRVNALLESKLLLKDWKRGLVTWAKDVSGLKPEAQKDIISRINRMENILNPADEQAFLQDLANQKLGIHVPLEAAQKLTELAMQATQFKSKADENGQFPTMEDRMQYGYAMEDFRTYYNGMINAAEKMTIKDYLKHPIKAIDVGFHTMAGLQKSLLSTLDDSVIGRQGQKTLLDDIFNLISRPMQGKKPTRQWWDNAWRTFTYAWKTWGGKNMEREVNAEIISRPNSINGLYAKHRVALNIMEENYPEHLGNIPVIGRALKGFENAFTLFQKRNRADTFDALVNIAKAAGRDPFSSDIDGFGKLANTITARGSLEIGRHNFEASADFVNLVAFSGRFLKSSLDFITFNQLHAGMSPYARKVAAIQSLKGIVTIGAILALIDTINPDSVEWDTNKKTFGGIRIGNKIYEPFKMYTSFIVLASRLLTGKYTTAKGKTIKINSGKYGAITGRDLFVDFFAGKESPMMRWFDDVYLRGETYNGDPPTILNELKQSFTPIPAQQTMQDMDNPYLRDADKIGGWIADELGVSSSPIRRPKK